MVCPAWSRTPVLNQKLAAYRASERAIVEDQYQAADMLYFQGVFAGSNMIQSTISSKVIPSPKLRVRP